MLCSPETFVTQRSDVNTDPPIKIDFFISHESGHLLYRIEAKNMFSIYEISSMDTEFVDESNPIIPIANIDTIVIDECNFDTNYNRRYLQTKVIVPKRPK